MHELLELGFMRTKLQVDRLVKVTVDEYTKAALYSFASNVATGTHAKSTILKKPKALPPPAWMMQSPPDQLNPLSEIIGYPETELQSQSR